MTYKELEFIEYLQYCSTKYLEIKSFEGEDKFWLNMLNKFDKEDKMKAKVINVDNLLDAETLQPCHAVTIKYSLELVAGKPRQEAMQTLLDAFEFAISEYHQLTIAEQKKLNADYEEMKASHREFKERLKNNAEARTIRAATKAVCEG